MPEPRSAEQDVPRVAARVMSLVTAVVVLGMAGIAFARPQTAAWGAFIVAGLASGIVIGGWLRP